MSLAEWSAAWLASPVPALPQPGLVRLAMSWGWGLVLAALAWSWLRGRTRALRVGFVSVVLALSALPGSWSPGYWLGLVFQAPSLVLIAWILLRAHDPATLARWLPPAGPWTVVLVLWGWVLLLDTWGVWPQSVYAWGFSPWAVAALAFLAGAACVKWSVAFAPGSGARVMALVLLVFVSTRLPTGNVWDALLDPWLWLILHVGLLGALWKGVRARRTV